MIHIKINQPYALNEIGGRENNEDSIFPSKKCASKSDDLFLVCDGVGGSDKGEIASLLACNSFSNYFDLKPEIKEISINEDYIQGALEYTQDKIDEYLVNNPNSKGMGTTLTLLSLNTNGATIAHIGDSRVYHIRNRNIIYKTQDHSLVKELVKEGIITEENAKTHPQKNIITRAIQGNSVKPTFADVSTQTDVQAEDYFFLCSDGILEQVTDEILVDIITSKRTDEEKINEIDSICKGNTKDNYSCYLVPIAEVEYNLEEDIELSVINEKKDIKSLLDIGFKSFKNLFKKQ